MKMKNDTLEVEKKEIDFMLKMFLKQYRYFNNNKLPKRIVFANVPTLELTENFWEEHKDEEIPIKYSEADTSVELGKIETLGIALHSVLLSAGVINSDVTMPSYPELLLAAEEFVASKEKDAASRPLRASGTNKPAPAERGSGSGKLESATDE